MKNFHANGKCPIRDVLSRLGDKWSMLVLVTLEANADGDPAYPRGGRVSVAQGVR